MSAVAAVTITVSEVNDAPVAVDDNNFSTNEDTTLTGDVRANDSDIDNTNAELDVVRLSGPANGTLTLNGDGTFEYIPDADFFGVDSFTYQLRDPGGELSAVATVTITVNPRNDAPVGVSQTIPVLEDSVFEFSAADFGFSDASDNTDSLQSVRIVSFNGNGSLTLDGVDPSGTVVNVADISRLQFTPAENAFGPGLSTVAFQVIDDGAVGPGNFNEDLTTRTITFDVTSVNDRPVGQDFTVELDEGSSRSLSVTDFILTDLSDDPLENILQSIRIVDWTGPGHVALDGEELSVNTEVSIADINRLTIEAENVDADSVGSIQFTVIDNGSTANGGEVESDIHTIDFAVRQLNDAPEVATAQYNNPENVIQSHRINVVDANGDDVTLSFAGTDNDNALFEFSEDGQSIRFKDAPNFESPQSIGGENEYIVEVVATDSQGDSSEPQTVTVNVQNVVEAAVLMNDNFIDDGSGVSESSLFANDNGGVPFSDDATVTVVGQPDSGFVEINPDGTFVFTPTAEGFSAVEFTYQVEIGGEISTADATFTQAPPLPIAPTDTTPVDNDNEPTDETELGETIDPDLVPMITTDSPDEVNTRSDTPRGAAVTPNGADTLNNEITVNDSDFDFVGFDEALASNNYFVNFIDTGLLTSDFASRVVVVSRAGLQEFAEDFALATFFWEELDTASSDYIETSIGDIETALTVGAFGASVAVGLIARWALIGISLGATYSQPLWVTTFDFLPVVDSDDDESIQQIVDDQS